MKMDFQVALLSALSTIAGIIVTLIFNIIQRKQQFAQDGERDAQRRKHELDLKKMEFQGVMEKRLEDMKAEKKAQQRDLIVKFLYAMDLTYEYLIEIKYYLHKPNLVEEIHRTKQLHAREATSCFLQLDILCMGELRRALVELYSAHISYTQKAYDWLQKADPNAEWPVLDAVTKARLRFLDIVRSELA